MSNPYKLERKASLAKLAKDAKKILSHGLLWVLNQKIFLLKVPFALFACFARKILAL